ncbi:phage portal protein, partial [Mesorhizobium sp. ZMM04-4]
PISFQFSMAGDKGLDGAGSVDSVNAQTGAVVLEADDINTTALGTFGGDDVEFVLDDHDARVTTLEADIVSLTATAIANTPAGGVSAMTVQAAINELDADKVGITAIREKLTADRTYYVRADGSDSNDGLANASGGAFLTKQKAINVVAALDISIYNVTIQVEDGTYSGGVNVNAPWIGSGEVTLQGNLTTPANCVISVTSANCILVTNYGRLRVRGFKVQTTTSGIGVAAQNGGVLSVVGNMDYGACATAHIYAERTGVLGITASYTISGNAPCHMQALSHAYIFNFVTTVTLSGTRAFSTAFAKCDRMALMEFSGNTFTGSATGTRYTVTSGAGINTFGGGATYLPGSGAGAATSPGWYA